MHSQRDMIRHGAHAAVGVCLAVGLAASAAAGVGVAVDLPAVSTLYETYAVPTGHAGSAAGHREYVCVKALRSRGCFASMPALPDPEAGMTRAGFTHLLVRSADVHPLHGNTAALLSPFRDVPPRHWAVGSLVEAYERGWVKGYGDGRFRPDSVLSRAEAAVLLGRALQSFVSSELTKDSRAPAAAEAAAGNSVPEWARREVAIALRMGWLVPDADGDLRLHDPVTFGEACALVWRSMGVMGRQYDLAGVLRSVDAAGGWVELAGNAGETRVRVDPKAAVFRNGESCSLDSIKPLDEAFVILGASGNATFVEARFIDDVGFVDSIGEGAGEGGGVLWYTDRSGVARRALVDASTEVYVQRNKSTLSEVSRGDRVYLVFDSVRGAVRIMDVAKMNAGGRVVRVSAAGSSLTVRMAGSGTETLGVDEYAVFYRDGKMCSLEDIREGDIFQGSVDADGRVLFLQAFSAGAR